MKTRIHNYFRQLASDRWLLGLLVANTAVAVIVCIAIAISIEPKETQVITQYSAFAATGFYRNYWYSLWMYVLVELAVVIGHGLLAVKLTQLNRRDIGLALLWLTLALSAVVYLFAHSIIGIAALG